jgi:hypothetical protein
MLGVQLRSGKNSKDVLNVYWSPFYDRFSNSGDWSFLYPEPKNLFSILMENKNPDSGKSNYFACPAFAQKTKNTYVFFNPINCSYEYNNNEINPLTENWIEVESEHEPSVLNSRLFTFSLRYLFFAEEPLIASFTPPYFSKPEYTHYGTILMGDFDIGQWFRPYNFEIQTWSNSGQIHLKENEPIFYVQFQTDKKIKFHRFNENEQLKKYATACVDSKFLFGRNQPLMKDYLRFNRVGMRQKILNEIKSNLC